MDICVFAVDFSCDAMTASFVQSGGEEIDTASFDLADFLAGGSEPLDKLIALLTAKSRASQVKADGVMVSVAADIDRGRRVILNYPDAFWLNKVSLPDLLSQALGLPVRMDRRAIVHLVYDMAMLGLPEQALAVGCYVDTHYQNAIWHGGGPIQGLHGTAGNIAHLTIHEREDNCFCGKLGCVDLYGAGVRLEQIHTMIFPDTPLDELFVRHGEHPIILDYLSMMAYPIAMQCNILDPEFLILGGRIPSMPGFPRKFLEEEIVRQTYSPSEGQRLTFLPSPGSDLPGVIPAAQYAIVRGFA